MLKSLGPFLFGALDPINAVGDPSIASAGRALEIIDVGSKNTLMAVMSSVVPPVRSGLVQAGFVCQSVSAVLWTHPPQAWVCCFQPCFVLWAQNQRAVRAKPIKYSGIHLPQRINRRFRYLCNSVALDLNDLSQGK